jgi:hypothetical protein
MIILPTMKTRLRGVTGAETRTLVVTTHRCELCEHEHETKGPKQILELLLEMLWLLLPFVHQF